MLPDFSRKSLASGATNSAIRAAALGKKFAGGYADGFVDQPFNEEYDPATNSWRGRAPMLRGLNHVGAVGLNGKV